MSERVTFVVAGTPVGKGRPRFVRATGHTYTPERTASYEAMIGWHAREAMNGRTPLTMPLFVSVEAYMPVPGSWSRKRQEEALDGFRWPSTRPDLDNLLKLLMDSLNGVVWVDDKQVVEVDMHKIYGARPRLEVTVEPKALQLQDGKG